MLFDGNETIATGVLPPSLALQTDPYFVDGDIELARQCFYEGLEETGLTTETFPKITLAYAFNEGQQIVIESVCQHWAEAFGIEINIQALSWETFASKHKSREYEIYGLAWCSWIYDPIYNLTHITSWQNSEYTALLEKANQTCEPRQRKIYLHEAEKLLIAQMPLAPLFFYSCQYIKKDRLQDMYVSQLGRIDFKWAYLT